MGRQPIFGPDLAVFGYHLLFGSFDATRVPAHSDDTLPTADIVVSSSDSADRFAGRSRLFSPASDEVLSGAVTVAVPGDRLVLEVPASRGGQEDSVAACRRLRDEGQTVALEGFRWVDGAADLLGSVAMVKLDRAATQGRELSATVEGCHEAGVTVIACGVDSPEDRDRCADVGVDLLQGNLLSHVRAEGDRGLDAGRLARLRMSTQLLNDECSVAQIESIVRTDPAMTHQLLQLAAIGAPGGLKRNVRTIREALVLVGWRRLQSWVALLMLTDGGGVSDEAVTLALYRARLVEAMAGSVERGLAGPGFMVGMLSTLDVLLGAPLERVLVSMSVADELREALLNRKGQLGLLVADAFDVQLGRANAATRAGLDPVRWAMASVEALGWAVQVTAAIDDSTR